MLKYILPWVVVACSEIEKLPQLDFIPEEVLSKGLFEMKHQRIVFAGIARNNADDFNSMKENIERVGAKFNDYRVVLFENDSNDGTKELFEQWAASNPKIIILSKDFHNKKRPSIQFLAEARNFYLEYVQKHFSDFDILAVVDMDMSYGWDERGIEHSFSLMSEWDAVGANGISNAKGEMYDAFAWRSVEFPHEVDHTTSNEVSKHYWKSVIPRIQKVHPATESLMEVDSVFGGLAFYKMQYVLGCKYTSVRENCEHVPFHKCLKQKGGRIFFNPAMIIRYAHYK
jgi:hypothetical protein